MLKYIPAVMQVFTHCSGAAFRFRPVCRNTEREFRELTSKDIVPFDAVVKHPVTGLLTLDLNKVSARGLAVLELDRYRYPAYLLDSCPGLVDEAGDPHDIGLWDIDQRTDLILTACEQDPAMEPWLKRLVSGPEKKSTGLDSGQQLVDSPELPGLLTEEPSTRMPAGGELHTPEPSSGCSQQGARESE